MYILVYRWIVLRMGYVTDKRCRENKTHILCSIIFSKLVPFMLHNVKEHDWAGQANIIWRMRFSCRISKTTNTHRDYVILTAFSRQKCSREYTPVLRYTYIAYLCCIYGTFKDAVGNSVFTASNDNRWVTWTRKRLEVTNGFWILSRYSGVLEKKHKNPALIIRLDASIWTWTFPNMKHEC